MLLGGSIRFLGGHMEVQPLVFLGKREDVGVFYRGGPIFPNWDSLLMVNLISEAMHGWYEDHPLPSSIVLLR
jgi:hypothetical protein